MNVRMLVSIVGHADLRYDLPDFSFAPGDEVELDDALASAWITGGLAEEPPVKSPAKISAKAEAAAKAQAKAEATAKAQAEAEATAKAQAEVEAAAGPAKEGE